MPVLNGVKPSAIPVHAPPAIIAETWARQVGPDRGVLGAARRCHRNIIHDCLAGHRRRQRLGHLAVLRRASLAQLALPCLNQPRGSIMAPANIGNPRARRQRLGGDLQPFLGTPPSAPLRSRQHRHLTHRPLSKHTLGSARYLPAQGGPRPMSTLAAGCSADKKKTRHPGHGWRVFRPMGWGPPPLDKRVAGAATK